MPGRGSLSLEHARASRRVFVCALNKSTGWSCDVWETTATSHTAGSLPRAWQGSGQLDVTVQEGALGGLSDLNERAEGLGAEDRDVVPESARANADFVGLLGV